MISLKEYFVLYGISLLATFYYQRGILTEMNEKKHKMKVRYSAGANAYILLGSTLGAFINNFLCVGIYVVFASIIGYLS